MGDCNKEGNRGITTANQASCVLLHKIWKAKKNSVSTKLRF